MTTPAVTAARRDLAHAELVAAAWVEYTAAAGGRRPTRWTPSAARDQWVATVHQVHTERGGGWGARAFIARAAGVHHETIARALKHDTP